MIMFHFVHHRASHLSEEKKCRRRHSAMHKTCEDAMKVLRGLSKGKKVAGIPEQVPRSLEHTRNNAAVLQKITMSDGPFWETQPMSRMSKRKRNIFAPAACPSTIELQNVFRSLAVTMRRCFRKDSLGMHADGHNRIF